MEHRILTVTEVEEHPDHIYELGSTSLSGGDIARLVRDAKAARGNSYAPYSRFNIGAAVLLENNDGQRGFFKGTNVENAAYGSTICAECSAIVHAVTCGFRTLLACCVVPDFDSSREVAPCGNCRQVINEFAVGECPLLLVDSDDIIHVFIHEDLLSKSFGPADLGFEASDYVAGPKQVE